MAVRANHQALVTKLVVNRIATIENGSPAPASILVRGTANLRADQPTIRCLFGAIAVSLIPRSQHSDTLIWLFTRTFSVLTLLGRG